MIEVVVDVVVLVSPVRSAKAVSLLRELGLVAELGIGSTRSAVSKERGLRKGKKRGCSDDPAREKGSARRSKRQETGPVRVSCAGKRK